MPDVETRYPHRRRLLYLSGALRVSTQRSARSGGARSHILGVIGAFERAGWIVDRYIAGDELASRFHGRPGNASAGRSGRRGGIARRLAADVVRLASGTVNTFAVRRRFEPETSWVYERFASMQQLGRVAQRRGIPWVLETQGPFFEEASTDRGTMLLTGLAKRIEIDAYRRCDALVCVTTSLRDLIVDVADIDASKVLVVPNGVDGATFDPANGRAVRLTSNETFTIGYVGGLPKWQALDRLFAAVARVRERIGDIAVVIVGGGSEEAAWRRRADELGVASAVHWVGPVPRDEVPSYIQGFDVGYSGQVRSTTGSMYHSPLKLYEYLAMGVPFVASAFDDARRLMESTGAGLLFEPDHEASLDAALIEAHRRHVGRSVDPAAMRRTLLREHSWDRRVDSIVSGVERLLAERWDP